MAKSKKKSLQSLTDEELMQVTGGYPTFLPIEDYDAMDAECKKRSKEVCDDLSYCDWNKRFHVCDVDSNQYLRDDHPNTSG